MLVEERHVEEGVDMGWHRRHRGETEAPETSQLVRECSAFLTGTLAREHALHCEMVRDWEWVNLLAHGSVGQLQEVARDRLLPPPTNPYDERWHGAVAFLAGELLRAIRNGSLSLDQVQHDVLVPLELEMANVGSRAASPVRTVRRVLEDLQLRPPIGGETTGC